MKKMWACLVLAGCLPAFFLTIRVLGLLALPVAALALFWTQPVLDSILFQAFAKPGKRH